MAYKELKLRGGGVTIHAYRAPQIGLNMRCLRLHPGWVIAIDLPGVTLVMDTVVPL